VREFGHALVFCLVSLGLQPSQSFPHQDFSASRSCPRFHSSDFCRRPRVLVYVPTGFSQRAHPSAPGPTIIFSWFQLWCSVQIFIAIFWPRVLQPVSILVLWVLLDFSLEPFPPLADLHLQFFLLDFRYAAHGSASVSCGRSGLGSHVWIPPSVHRVPRFQLAASSPAVIFSQIFCSFFRLFSSAGMSIVPVSIRHLSSLFVGSSPGRGCHSALVIYSLITLCVVLDLVKIIAG
jgi:hypothetical protein